MSAKRYLLSAVVLIASFCLPVLAPADDYETVDNLKNIAREFVQTNVPVAADEVLNVKTNSDVYAPKLPLCHQKISAEFPQNTNPGQVTGVALYCNDTTGWHTVVPVNVQVLTKVVVARRTILAKEEITDELLDYQTYDKNVLFDSYYKDKSEILGQIASHLITPGMVMTKRNLQAPVLIHKNQMVDLVATTHSVSVSMQGIAKSEGCLNETIKVYNPSSKRTVDAVVAGPNRAEITA